MIAFEVVAGYLMVANDLAAIQNLEKKRGSQEYFFQLEVEMRVEEFTEDVISNEGNGWMVVLIIVVMILAVGFFSWLIWKRKNRLANCKI